MRLLCLLVISEATPTKSHEHACLNELNNDSNRHAKVDGGKPESLSPKCSMNNRNLETDIRVQAEYHRSKVSKPLERFSPLPMLRQKG